jgi:hypothetical protein
MYSWELAVRGLSERALRSNSAAAQVDRVGGNTIDELLDL